MVRESKSAKSFLIFERTHYLYVFYANVSERFFLRMCNLVGAQSVVLVGRFEFIRQLARLAAPTMIIITVALNDNLHFDMP